MRWYVTAVAAMALLAAACTGSDGEATPTTVAPPVTTEVPPPPSTTTTQAPTTTRAPSPPPVTTPPPEPLTLVEYLASLYEVNAELTVAQGAAGGPTGGDPATFIAPLARYQTALSVLDPPPEAEALQESQMSVATGLLSATREFVRAIESGGPAAVEALEDYLEATADLAGASLEGQTLLRDLVVPLLETAGDPISAFMAEVALVSLGNRQVQEDVFALLQELTTDPIRALEGFAPLVGEFEAERDRWAALDPPPEAAALHGGQLQVYEDYIPLLAELGTALQVGDEPSLAFSLEIQRLGREAVRVGVGWAYLFADVLRGEVRPLSGTHVSVTGQGNGTTNEDDAKSIRDSLEAFSRETGVRVSYETTGELSIALAAGANPDIGIFTNPGDLLALVGERVLPVPADVAGGIALEWPDGWLDITARDGAFYGVPTFASVKSLVWYRPDAFLAGGYAVPESWDDLLALTAQMIDDGAVPWCVGIGSGPSTGWPFTDWIEDVLLRTEPTDVYDAWVDHDIPFDDDRVAAAWNAVLDLWNTEGAVYTPGGSIATSGWNVSSGLLAGECLMFRQGAFVASAVPRGTVFGADGIDAFLLPGSSPEDRPILVSGEFAGALRDAPEVWATIDYLSSGQHAAERQLSLVGTRGSPTGFLSANLFQALTYYSDIERTMVEIMQNATVARVDGSDQMPEIVGSGTFWSEGTFAVTGEKTVDEALAAIEASWAAAEAAFFDIGVNLQACREGNDLACDLVLLLASQGSEAAQIGFDCAGRRVDNDTACSGYDGNPSNHGPGDNELLDALWELCSNRNLQACDALYFISPEGSEYEALADERRFGLFDSGG